MKEKSKYETFDLGTDFFYGYSQKKNFKKAFPLLLKAAKAGIPHAQNLVGFCFDRGLGVIKNYKMAFYWYKKACHGKQNEMSKYNRGVALCNLALVYELGQGTSKDQKKAFHYYKKAAQLRDIEAQCNLGILYLDGSGCQQNFQKGIKWLKKAAQRGDNKAEYSLGLCYLKGEGVSKNTKHAITWMKKAATTGHKKAVRKLKSIQK